MILHDSSLIKKLSKAIVLLDTNVFVMAMLVEDFGQYLSDIKKGGCELVTIHPVFSEFVERSTSVIAYKKRQEVIQSLTTTFLPIARLISEKKNYFKPYTIIFSQACQGMKGGVAYPDMLLTLALMHYQHEDVYLLTSNILHFPLSILERVDVITIDNGKQIFNQALYRLRKDRVNDLAKELSSPLS